MPSTIKDRRRRRVLATLACSPFINTSIAQGSAAPARPVRVTQLLDTSPDQQELSRDYSTGLRLAFAELDKAGARVPRLATLETDGSEASVEQAMRSVRADTAQLALVGTVGERLALASIGAAKKLGFEIAHLGPWLADTRFDMDAGVLPLFASRETQIDKALASLAGIGVAEVGLVYADDRTAAALHEGVATAAARARLRTQRFVVAARQDAGAFAAGLPSNSPVILFFFGGTIELALFSQGLAKRGSMRYVVCLADIDVTTLMQLGPGKGIPLVLTQVVPNPQSGNAEIVRSYRQTLRQLFDEEPSPVSLAGYLAGRYAAHALARTDASATRAAVLADLRRRTPLELGGWRFDFGRSARGSEFVSQTLLRGDGKLIG